MSRLGDIGFIAFIFGIGAAAVGGVLALVYGAVTVARWVWGG